MDRAVGLLFVLLLHAAALWGLWQHRMLPDAQQAMTLFVDFISPPTPERVDAPKELPKPKPIEKAKPQQIVAQSTSVAPSDYVVPAPPPQSAPQPVITAPAPMPAGPVTLAAELAVACPERTAPAYPASSRRLGEEGTVVLRVELDESGQVTTAQVQRSSGFARLDEAALNAVRSWRCTPAQRNGQPVRTVAQQPFKFILQGS